MGTARFQTLEIYDAQGVKLAQKVPSIGNFSSNHWKINPEL
jgi:hypothetical protein